MKMLGLVTAKSNSQRVPYKNKVMLHGRPLYKWTTDYLESVRQEFDTLVFSSDKPEEFIIDPDRWVKVHRPSTLCEDCTPHVLSVQHALNIVEKHNNTGIPYDYVILFQPTNPLRDVHDLYTMLTMLHENRPMVGKTYYIDENLRMSYIEAASGWKEGYADASGSGVLIRSGNMYAYSRSYLLGGDRSFNDYDSVYVSIPKHRGYNINDEEDFGIVESFIKRYKCKSRKSPQKLHHS